MGTATFEQSLEQRMAALSKANSVRIGNAAIKADLKAGSRQLGDVLLNPPACVLSARIFDLLIAVPRVGPAKAKVLLKQLCATDETRVASLSADRRVEFAKAVVDRAWVGSMPHRRRSTRCCTSCGDQLRRGTPPGRCGFCIAENALPRTEL